MLLLDFRKHIQAGINTENMKPEVVNFAKLAKSILDWIFNNYGCLIKHWDRMKPKVVKFGEVAKIISDWII